MKTTSYTLRVLLALAVLLPGLALAEEPAPTAVAEEEAFLDILPKIDVPDDVLPIPGAVNEEFRNCTAFWPIEYLRSQSGREARAYRDIYGYVKVRNVLLTRDCTCNGKVANWSDVEGIAVGIRKETGHDQLNWQDTKPVFQLSNELFPVAETICGGSF